MFYIDTSICFMFHVGKMLKSIPTRHFYVYEQKFRSYNFTNIKRRGHFPI